MVGNLEMVKFLANYEYWVVLEDCYVIETLKIAPNQY